MKLSPLSLWILAFLCFTNITFSQITFTVNTSILETVTGGFEDCAVDMNGDFLDDIVRVKSNGINIDYQQADGTFIHSFFPMTIENTPDWSIAAGDIDNNGFNDLVLGDGNAVSFIMANENGTEYTEIAHPEYIFSQRSTFADIDNDGLLDAFVCHDVDQSHPYRNDGAGNMVLDQTLIETLDMPGNYAALWVDYDNDWDTDLFITKCKQNSIPGDIHRTNRMYRNNGDGTYTEVAEEIGLADNAQSWATVWEDFDNDGDFDAFVVNHDEANRFYKNEGGVFIEMIDETAISKTDLGAWENAAADFDNDGYVDIFSELNNEIYFNNGDMTFTGHSFNFDDGGIGDFNNDGFMDVVKGNNVWLNDGNDNNYLKINTVGTESNRNGIGARIEIYGEWGVQIREVRSGESFSPMSTLATHFGIGQSDNIEMLVVKWPSGMINMIENPPINATLTVVEGETNCFGDSFEIEVDGELSICPGESIQLIAADGSDYTWSNGETTQNIEVSEAGNYNVFITDADGCVAFSNNISVEILEEEEVTIQAMSETVFCEGASVFLTSNEAESYLWSNGEITQEIEVFETGEYMVNVPGICEAELTSEAIIVDVLDAIEPEVSDVTVEFSGAATLEATGENIVWYDQEIGGNPIATGNIYETPVVSETTTYYAESTTIYGGEEEDGGKPDNSGNGGLPSTGAYNYFNVWEVFTLQTVTVIVPDNAPEGIRNISLVDELGQTLETAEFDLIYGENIIELNWEVPIGLEMSLRCTENNLFRNNQGVDYPYNIGSVGEIYSSFYGEQYYYYFYDWKIKKEGWECVSERVGATVVVTSTNDLHLFNELKIYPNPASDAVNVDFNLKNSQVTKVSIYDAFGKNIYSNQLNITGNNLNQINIPISNLPNGVYTLKMDLEEGQIVEKIIVQK